MNILKKLVLGALTTGILVSPLATTASQANAAEQEVSPANTKPGQDVTLNEDQSVDYYLNAEQTLKHQAIGFTLDGNRYYTLYPQYHILANYVEKAGETVDSSKIYHFKLKPNFIALGYNGLMDIDSGRIEYIGSAK